MSGVVLSIRARRKGGLSLAAYQCLALLSILSFVLNEQLNVILQLERGIAIMYLLRTGATEQ